MGQFVGRDQVSFVPQPRLVRQSAAHIEFAQPSSAVGENERKTATRIIRPRQSHSAGEQNKCHGPSETGRSFRSVQFGRQPKPGKQDPGRYQCISQRFTRATKPAGG